MAVWLDKPYVACFKSIWRDVPDPDNIWSRFSVVFGLSLMSRFIIGLKVKAWGVTVKTNRERFSCQTYSFFQQFLNHFDQAIVQKSNFVTSGWIFLFIGTCSIKYRYVIDIESGWTLDLDGSGVWGWLWWNDVWSGMFLIILNTNQANKLRSTTRRFFVFFMIFHTLVEFCRHIAFLKLKNVFLHVEIMGLLGNLQIGSNMFSGNRFSFL